MAHDFKPFQLIVLLISVESSLLQGDADLLFDCIHPVEIGQQQTSAAALGNDDTVAFDIQLIRGINMLRIAEDINSDLQLIQF